MKFGFRTPSLKKRIAARTSWKRVVRHSMGLKAPRGYGAFTNPKKALYNRVYRRTSFGIEDLVKHSHTNHSNGAVTSSVPITPQSFTPVSHDDPFTFNPHSFTQLIHTKDKFGEDGWATVIIVLGTIFLIGSPIVGLVLLIGGGYWMYRITKQPSYKLKKKLQKAKKLMRDEKFEDAVPFLQEAIGYDQSNPELNYLLGVALHVVGKYEESVEPLKRYLDSNPNDLDGKLVLAYSYYKLKQFKEVIPLLQQFPEDHPSYLLVIVLLGDSFLGLKEYDLAINVLNRGPVRKTNLDNYLIYLHYLLGVAYKEKGEKQNALRHLRRVYSVDMNYKDVAKEVQELGGNISGEKI